VRTGRLLDLSLAGGWIATGKSYGVGAVLRLDFNHPEDGRRVGVDARVIRLVRLARSRLGSYGVAVELTGPMVDLDEQKPPSEGPGQHRIRERRQGDLWIPLEFHLGGGDTHRGSLEDISMRGLRIIGRVAPDEGTRIRIQMLPPKKSLCPRVGLLGVVQWSQPSGNGYAFGVDIEEVGSRTATEAWAEYVLARMMSGDFNADACEAS
jgi:hypothetical protein